MIDDWFSLIKLPLNVQQFRKLPRNSAYKYEYIDGKAWLTPRPKSGRAVLDLAAFSPPIAEIAGHENLTVRPLEDADWDKLPPLFAAAFHLVQPFASLTDKDRRRAAEDCLLHTRNSGDGPVVEPACFVAAAPDGRLAGAALITRPDDEHVDDEPSRPHLTWIFVAPCLDATALPRPCLAPPCGCSCSKAAANCGARSCWATKAARFGTGGPASGCWRTAGRGGRSGN